MQLWTRQRMHLPEGLLLRLQRLSRTAPRARTAANATSEPTNKPFRA
ncbi:MAG: hypothetical protein IRY90_20605 [Actinomadura rubrobrunea]|nr:hypothetical protein [Actinomadura rubrobrunea]